MNPSIKKFISYLCNQIILFFNKMAYALFGIPVFCRPKPCTINPIYVRSSPVIVSHKVTTSMESKPLCETQTQILPVQPCIPINTPPPGSSHTVSS